MERREAGRMLFLFKDEDDFGTDWRMATDVDDDDDDGGVRSVPSRNESGIEGYR